MVVGEDQPITRQGVVCVLEEAGFEVVGVAADAPDLIRKTRAHRPDVVITDIQMPPGNTARRRRPPAPHESARTHSSETRTARSACWLLPSSGKRFSPRHIRAASRRTRPRSTPTTPVVGSTGLWLESFRDRVHQGTPSLRERRMSRARELPGPLPGPPRWGPNDARSRGRSHPDDESWRVAVRVGGHNALSGSRANEDAAPPGTARRSAREHTGATTAP